MEGKNHGEEGTTPPAGPRLVQKLENRSVNKTTKVIQ